MMGILSWVLIGLMVWVFTGIIYKMRSWRIIVTILASLLGAAVGGLDVAVLYRAPGAFYSFQWAGMLAALIGAFLMVALTGLLSMSKRPAR